MPVICQPQTFHQTGKEGGCWVSPLSTFEAAKKVHVCLYRGGEAGAGPAASPAAPPRTPTLTSEGSGEAGGVVGGGVGGGEAGRAEPGGRGAGACEPWPAARRPVTPCSAASSSSSSSSAAAAVRTFGLRREKRGSAQRRRRRPSIPQHPPPKLFPFPFPKSSPIFNP